MEGHQLLYDHQGAYQCGRSSEQILLHAIDTIVNSLDGGAVVCAAFLDLHKAFDSLDHVVLLQRLHCLGVCGASLRWFASYLSDRVQLVKSGGFFLSGVQSWGYTSGHAVP